ncbi:hypothetical protein DFH11DRAFT_1798880 [Phellopilus nigrolimitatus]|nr:hypothetical protein DFH11DRAFT_1798880 [Phellopilus nigrolimitatus]
MNNTDDLLASSSLTTTNKTMSSKTSSDSANSSVQSSPDSSRSDSPPANFDRPIDPFMNYAAAGPLSSGGSSAEKSLLTGLAAMSFDDFNSDMSLWDFDPASLDVPLQFDSNMSADEAFPLSHASGTNASTDLSSFAFSFGTDNLLDLPALSSDASTRYLNAAPSSSLSGAALPSATNHTQQAPASVPTQPPAQPVAQSQLSGNEAVDELVQRAKQIVGITSIAPVEADRTQSSKLPIPRLQQPMTMPSSSSAASFTASQNPYIPAARSKTSHTTIVRRYRSNFNAHLKSLRAVIPALRVLEQKAGNRVGNLALKSGTRRAGTDADAGTAGEEEEDVVDARGFVDGVKVPRKGSKTNVLVKATEYIGVLKRRELRLKREQEGLKALVSGLEGGPQLVREWEAMWKERFGGPEMDEVDGADGEADDENEEGEDEEDDEGGEDGGNEMHASAGKKRKRTKGKNAAAAAHPQPLRPVSIMPS